MVKEKSFKDDYRDFFEILNKHKIDYLIVGAYALMYYTKLPRTTRDIDVWIRPTEENINKSVNAINEFSGLNVSNKDLISEKEIFFLGREPYRFDIFKSQGKLLFNDAWMNKIKGKFWDIDVYYISKEHLIYLKKYFGREKDMEDIKKIKNKLKS